MLIEAAGRRTAAFTWTVMKEPSRLNEDGPFFERALYDFTASIPQDLSADLSWVLWPSIIVRVDTVRPVEGRNGLAAVVFNAYVDGARVNGGVVKKYGWGAGPLPPPVAFDPNRVPTPLPTTVDSNVEFYYEPGLTWRYYMVIPEPHLIGGHFDGDTLTIGDEQWPFDWRSAFVDEDDTFFLIHPPDVPSELRITLVFPNEYLGATWTVEDARLLMIPFNPRSTVRIGAGLSGFRPRGQIVGQHGAAVTPG